MPDAGDVVATYGFNVPCRRFIVNYTVTHDRPTSVVDEFVLRLLSLAESVPARRIGPFFSMSTGELEVVLQDLQGRGMLKVEGDRVRLTRYARELFRLVKGSFGRLVQVDPWVDAIWLDLVSRNLITPQGGRPADNLLALDSSTGARNLPEEFARSSFEDNFREVITNVRQVRSPDRFSLYAVADVIPDRYGSVVVTGEVRLELDPAPHFTRHFLEDESGSGQRFQHLRDAMDRHVGKLDHPTPSGAGVNAYRRLTGDASIGRHVDADVKERFRLHDWLASMNAAERSGRWAVFGATHLTRNIDRLVRAMRRRGGDIAGRRRAVAIRWFRPVGRGWGATPDMSAAIERLRSAVAELHRNSEITVETTVIAPQVTLTDTRRRFKRLFDNGLIARNPWLASSLEAIYVEGIAAMVVTHVAMGASVTLPVGLVTTDPGDLDRIAQGLHLDRLGRDCELLWRRRSSDADDPERQKEQDGATIQPLPDRIEVHGASGEG